MSHEESGGMEEAGKARDDGQTDEWDPLGSPPNVHDTCLVPARTSNTCEVPKDQISRYWRKQVICPFL